MANFLRNYENEHDISILIILIIFKIIFHLGKNIIKINFKFQ